MAKVQRPADDFWVTDLKSDLDIVRRHTAAGFDPLPRDAVRLRLFILYDFLWANGLLTERLAASPEDVKPGTALHNRHLTDDGYYFLQKYLPRWQAVQTHDRGQRACVPSQVVRAVRRVQERRTKRWCDSSRFLNL